MPLPLNPNTFANFPLDRAAHRRRDAAWLAAALAAPDARIAPFQKRQPFLLENGEAGWLSGQTAGLLGAGAAALFLGLDAAGAAHFAIETDSDLAETPMAGLGAFADMRAAAAILPGGDAAILGCAKAVFEWHARHRFCANCGAASAVVDAGWKRECPGCGGEHFPRVDPVVIMLATLGERCLLGRSARFAKNMYSALAGFVEPGESIEEACARELFEEAGVRATAVRYHSAQPWPFPSSLMIGLIAEVESDALTIDTEELESARWFTRAEAQAMIERRHAEIGVPAPLAIAHQLIKTWAFG